MNSLSRATIVQCILALGFVAATVGVVLYFGETPQYTLASGASMHPADDLFRKDIKEFGGVRAYDRMATAITGLPEDEQHGYAHSFGHVLYELKGEEGISVCDGRFNLGCFHQFLGDAITDLGTDSIARLYRECGAVIGSAETCQHGLGHGIVSGIGYSEDNLKEALSLCSQATHEKTYAGCYGGAFMEYNIRTIAGAEGTMGSRPLVHNDMYAPCTAVSVDDRAVCTFWLPEWWFFSLWQGQRDPLQRNDLFQKMGDLCEASPAPQSCYEGVGYIAPTVFGFDAGRSREACDHIMGGGALYCRGMAALIFHISAGHEADAPALCEGLGERARATCMRYAEHDNNFSFSVTMDP